MSSLPPGLPVQSAELATQGGNDEWYSYVGEIRFENVMVVDESNNKILLGLKKEGFGSGNYNPFAGPITEGEDGSVAAQRDLFEQTGLEAENVHFKGTIRVVLPELGGQSLHCSMYKVTKWKGQPKETQTMIPEWFAPEEIPYAKMFDDDIHWMPLFLQQPKLFSGRVDFAKAEKGQDVGRMLRWWFGTYE
ncbi:Nudix (Nucleoside diphosphate linked moiety X)-type motif 1 [Ceratobasidium sp. 370]|nr:Nudix (Nucleoside diphosphate linked moiety X)-type motif 1 [Ceratobasidium sp. 370]